MMKMKKKMKMNQEKLKEGSKGKSKKEELFVKENMLFALDGGEKK